MPSWIMIDEERLMQWPRDKGDSRSGIIWLRSPDPFGRRRRSRTEASPGRRKQAGSRRSRGAA